MRFLVPPESQPGVYREGVGFFKPGDTFSLPDLASMPGEVPSRNWVPLDEEARAALVAAHGAKARPIPASLEAAVEAAAPTKGDDAPMTIRNAVHRMAPAATRRHSDSK